MSKKHPPAKTAGGPQRGGANFGRGPVFTVGKPAHHHKPAKPAPATWQAGVQAGKRFAGKKHHPAASKKHHPKRGFSLGDVACCAAEAVTASLLLANPALSSTVDGAAVLALHRAAGGDDDAGAAILAALEAAYEHGLAGFRPVTFGPVDLDDPAARILGLALPAPHTVAVTADGWVSWGELWPAWAFPDAVTEEAWAVTWQ